MRDLLNVVLELPAHSIPTYVCKDLNQLPPLSMNNFDISHLIKNVECLQAQMQILQDAHSTGLQAQVAMSQKINSSSIPVVPALSCTSATSRTIANTYPSDNRSTTATLTPTHDVTNIARTDSRTSTEVINSVALNGLSLATMKLAVVTPTTPLTRVPQEMERVQTTVICFG